jgi:hypothetical protein
MQQKVEFDRYKSQDSVVLQTKNSLLKTKLELIIQDTLENEANAEFIRKTGKVLRPRRVCNKLILKHIPDDKTYIIPVIRFGLSRLYRLMPMYPNPHNDYWGVCEYKLIIFIVKNRKVVYKRAIRYGDIHTQTGPAITDYRSDVRLEHLGLIVEKAMEDYVKRIKKVE